MNIQKNTQNKIKVLFIFHYIKKTTIIISYTSFLKYNIKTSNLILKKVPIHLL